ncbi:hypothetical protein [Streptomyces poriferorum]|uniref:hypothetical protein n=2 Tax=Streptomyces poriferorum TaxID=2798799 RepID=UPI001C5FA06A|nr:hypothetical protein [Streptomyces poriferorum]MBW5259289.1 hypothetical protein [Streptomyces poriferorum]
MTYGLLTPEVPLGPFEGTEITVWSAQGKQARLHVSASCSYLRSAGVARRKVALDATVVGRLCPRCAEFGAWARRGTGLGIFLEALSGLGLLYQLDNYGAADEDAYSDDDVNQAATVLNRTPGSGQNDTEDQDEDDAWEALREAQAVREQVFDEWRRAASSLHRVHQILSLFPWLEPWAAPRVQLKRDRLNALLGQASRLVTTDVLILSAAVSAMDDPALPEDDPAFTPLGSPAEVARQLRSLWHRWQHKVTDGWDHPSQQTYLAHNLTDGMSSRRKGRDEMLARAGVLLAGWQAEAEKGTASGQAERDVIARLPHPDAAGRGYGDSPLSRLTEWELGVLASYAVETHWEQFTVALRVPEPVAARLLSRNESALSCIAQDAAVAAAPELPPEEEQPLGPGVFDDTPVSDRRPVTAAHLRAQRLASRDPDQLYLVFSMTAGPEVIALTVLERRCAAGWEGVIIAGADDLPGTLVEAQRDAASADGAPDGESVWLPRVHNSRNPDFGRSLSTGEGERLLARLCKGRQDVNRALRSLALARGVRDLRELDGRYEDEGRRLGPFTRDVWHGLLAMEQLDLEPFEPASDTGSGSDLPLGVLAPVQVYTTDAAGQYQGRAHSPACRHLRDLEVASDDDLVTIEQLLQNTRFDPCSKCGGYAIRRLSETQVSYYRAAHRLHNLTQTVGRTTVRRQDSSSLLTELDELEDLQSTDAWFNSDGTGARRWRRTVSQLRSTLTAATREK